MAVPSQTQSRQRKVGPLSQKKHSIIDQLSPVHSHQQPLQDHHHPGSGHHSPLLTALNSPGLTPTSTSPLSTSPPLPLSMSNFASNSSNGVPTLRKSVVMNGSASSSPSSTNNKLALGVVAAAAQPPHAAGPVNEPENEEAIYIVTDSANLFSGAQMVDGKRNMDIKVNLATALPLIDENRPIKQRIVVASFPERSNRMWRYFEQRRYQIIYKPEEVEVDDELYSQIQNVLTTAKESNRCLVLVTGDGNAHKGHFSFPQLMTSALQHGWTVEIVCWRSCINPVYETLRNDFPKKMRIRYLDNFRDEITFLKPRVPGGQVDQVDKHHGHHGHHGHGHHGHHHGGHHHGGHHYHGGHMHSGHHKSQHQADGMGKGYYGGGYGGEMMPPSRSSSHPSNNLMEDVRLSAPNLFEDGMMRGQWGMGGQQQGGHSSDSRRMMMDPLGGQRSFSMWAPMSQHGGAYHGDMGGHGWGMGGSMDSHHLRSSPIVVERPAATLPRGLGSIGVSSVPQKPWTSFDGLPSSNFGGWEQHGHGLPEPVFGDFTPSGSPDGRTLGSPSEELSSYTTCGSQAGANHSPRLTRDSSGDLMGVGFSRTRSIERDMGQLHLSAVEGTV